MNDEKLSDVAYALRLEDFIEHEGESAAIVRYGRGKVLKVVLK